MDYKQAKELFFKMDPRSEWIDAFEEMVEHYGESLFSTDRDWSMTSAKEEE